MTVNVRVHFLTADFMPGSKLVLNAPSVKAVEDSVEKRGGAVLETKIIAAKDLEAELEIERGRSNASRD